MPSTVKVRINGARNLPVMDGPTRAGAAVGGILNIAPSTDAYVSVTLGGHSGLVADYELEGGPEKCFTARTKICRRTVNPVWDEEFRFEVADDTLLQDEPLIFKVCDSEAMREDESIGLVYIDLNPLLTQTARVCPPFVAALSRTVTAKFMVRAADGTTSQVGISEPAITLDKTGMYLLPDVNGVLDLKFGPVVALATGGCVEI